MKQAAPQVSIIIPTYNRSNVLAYAMRSVLWSTFADWELLVVGDGCTDDTEQVVASFQDPRIRFMNLERNTGDQSAPNNEGFRQSTGRYIAYLHQDDLWLPDHLETAVRGIEDRGADLVFTLICSVAASGSRNRICCTTPTGRYEPYIDVPPSCWLVRRDLVEENGPWKFYRECYNVPSQEWLFRAWKAGKEMRLVPKLTVVHIPAGHRQDSYGLREYEEQRRYYQRMATETDFHETELTQALLRQGTGTAVERLRQIINNFSKRLCTRLGVHPYSMISLFYSPRKGGMTLQRRRRWGLEQQKKERSRSDREARLSLLRRVLSARFTRVLLRTSLTLETKPRLMRRARPWSKDQNPASRDRK